MEAKAAAKYVRLSPRKARQVMDLIRGKNVTEAMSILKFTSKRASGIIGKVLKSALANAKQKPDIDSEKLSVRRAFVDQGPMLKRFRPRAMGRASRIHKRTSHITVVVGDKEPARGARLPDGQGSAKARLGGKSGTESSSRKL